MNRRLTPILLGWLLLRVLPLPVAASDPEAGMIDPAEVGRSPGLNGKVVSLDDRIRYFYDSKKGQGLDEFLIRRSDAIFRLPRSLRPEHAPREPVARVSGIVKFEEGRWYVDVTGLELLPADLTRLNTEVKRFAPNDFASRRAWGLWAQRRGKIFNDEPLERRGRDLETDALWVEAQASGADPVALARRDAARPITPETLGGLFHLGFRQRLAKAKVSDELGAIVREIESALPASKEARETSIDLGVWEKSYEANPGQSYREAPAAIRQGLDRRLLNDARQSWFLKRSTDRPGSAIAIADEARAIMPDRPRLISRLRSSGLDNAEAEVTNLRQSEVEALAKTFRDDGEPERATRLLRAWLAHRRKNRLSATDAEGRILLAGQYDALVSDRLTAADLLREAIAIDPESREAADAFRRMGYRKVEGNWVEPTADAPATADRSAPTGGTEALPAQGVGPRNDDSQGESLRGLTRAQVRSRLGGKPDRTVRVAVQGRTVEQWIYQGPKGTQVVNFLHLPGRAQPLAISSYLYARIAP